MQQLILRDREKRILNVKSFFNLYKDDSLIMIKANIPGLNKNLPLASYLIQVFFNHLKGLYSFFHIEYFESYDGPYLLCGLKEKKEHIKKHLVKIENEHKLGRFIDLDYFVNGEKSLSRFDLNLPLRKCVLCDDTALVCIRNETHTTKEILHYIEKTTVKYFSNLVVDLADYAILRELKVDNKFGLVSFTSTGSHKDMDYELMIKGKDAILSYFKKMFIEGYKSTNLTTLLSEVRKYGIEAEQKMFLATNGVNSYKGVIFLLGILCLSFGYTLKTSNDFEMLFTNTEIIAEKIYDDFDLGYDTAGVKLYHQYGITGVRGIVKEGYKTVKENLDKISVTSSDKELRNLLYHYVITTDDTVFIKRSKSYNNYLTYKEVIKQYDPNDLEDLKSLNEFAEKFNLSFGGSADLLIVTIFLINLRECFIIK